jgi:hypothetical protein
MFKTKFIITVTIFITFLLITSIIKNKTRILEKQILTLDSKILLKEKDVNEAELDFYYLSSPKKIEQKLAQIGFNNYQHIDYSKIFLNLVDFLNIQKKVSIHKNFYEKKNQKR